MPCTHEGDPRDLLIKIWGCTFIFRPLYAVRCRTLAEARSVLAMHEGDLCKCVVSGSISPPRSLLRDLLTESMLPDSAGCRFMRSIYPRSTVAGAGADAWLMLLDLEQNGISVQCRSIESLTALGVWR